MDLLPVLQHQFDSVPQLARSTLQRFEQLILFVPLPAPSEAPNLGAIVSLKLYLPDSKNMLAATEDCAIRVKVRCYLRQPGHRGKAWLGVMIVDDCQRDIEQRVRYLTHAHSHEYGKLIAEIFT